MAHLTPPHARGTPTLYVDRAFEAVDDILPRVMALEAIEQLMTPWKAATQEDLADVDRTSLAWLLTVVSLDLRRHVEQAKAAAKEAMAAVREGGQ